MTAIQLATDEDMRAIDSRDLAKLDELPWLYIPVSAVDIPLPPLDFAIEGLDLMRSWGVAHVRTIADYIRLFPSALVASRFAGQFVDRAELLYHGAEPASAFQPCGRESGAG